MNNKTNIVIFVLIILGIAVAFVLMSGRAKMEDMDATKTPDTAKLEEAPAGVMDEVQSVEFSFFLDDVTEGEEIAPDVSTEGLATGTLEFLIKEKTTKMMATFNELPELTTDYFYEGWLVNTSTGGFISTGEALLGEDGVFVNEFVSEEDLTMYDLYVLTIEPDDGDPAPAGHVVEGPIVWGVDDIQDDSAEEASTGGVYQEYDPALLANADEGSVVLFFKADWCPTCNALDKDINENLTSLPGDVTVLTVDYDTATELKQQYDVRIQHTLVQVDSGGNAITSWVGSLTMDQFLSEII